MNIKKVAFFLSLTLLVGCRPAGVLQLPTTGGASMGATVQQDPQARKGSLAIAVKWPELSRPGFNTQVIPRTTKALLITIGDADNHLVYEELIKRPEYGSDPARREIPLNVGTGYVVQVKAYEGFGTQGDKEVPSGKLVATAERRGVEIVWNRKTSVPLPLDAEYAPSISGLFVDADTQLSTEHAGPGAELFLTGQNLTWYSGDKDAQNQPVAGLPEVVFPSGKVVTALTEGAGEKLRFTVPTGAGSGPLFLRVNGVPSATMSFSEVATFSLTAAKGGPDQALDDYLGDGVTRSWLGEAFPFSTLGYDTAQNLLVTVRATYSNANAAIGSIQPNDGAYQANLNSFGEDTVTARTGTVTATRKILVAPPAGSFIGLADPESNASGGLAMAKINDNRFIGAWYSKADQKVHWQLFDKDGALAGTHYSINAVERANVRMVNVAVQGNDALVAYTLENGFGMVSVNTDTGSANLDANNQLILKTYDEGEEGGKHFYHLGNVASNGSNYMVTYYTMNAQGQYSCNYKLIDLENSELKEKFSGTITFNNATISAYDYSQDAIGLAVNAANNYVIAYHLKISGGVDTYKTMVINPQGGMVAEGGGATRASNRIMSFGGIGTHYLSAAVENNSSVKAYLYGSDLVPTKTIDIDGTGLGAATPLANPTSVVWNGSEYLVTYTKNILDNGESKARPMVQAISSTGALLGSPQPIAKFGTCPTIVPTAEGAMAFWLTGNKNVVARRLKFH